MRSAVHIRFFRMLSFNSQWSVKTVNHITTQIGCVLSRVFPPFDSNWETKLKEKAANWKCNENTVPNYAANYGSRAHEETAWAQGFHYRGKFSFHKWQCELLLPHMHKQSSIIWLTRKTHNFAMPRKWTGNSHSAHGKVRNENRRSRSMEPRKRGKAFHVFYQH